MTTSSTAPDRQAAALAQARQLAGQGRHPEAEHLYMSVLATDPDQPDALLYLASREHFHQRFDHAIALLQRAARRRPDDPAILRNLGVACLADQRLEAARDALAAALRADPKFFPARLDLGVVLDRLGEPQAALLAYFRAIVEAQAVGQWRDEASTPPWLRSQVAQAMRFVTERRPAHFLELLEPVRARHGARSLDRVADCLAVWLGDLERRPVHPRQRPLFLYFPGLPETPIFDRGLFPWIPALEAAFADIRAELLQVLADDSGIEPFNRYTDEAQRDASLRGLHGTPNWNAFFFYRHGERNAANHARCPRTAAAVDALPLVRIREHGPEICFSVLTPGTHILPHTGVTNTRVVAHLPLVVPPDCALHVVGLLHAWREGEVFVFDDTFEHEAWNRSEQTRAILLMDMWNPHLTPAEQDAVALLVEGIGDFNAALRRDLPAFPYGPSPATA